jgi:antitoxin VapB
MDTFTDKIYKSGQRQSVRIPEAFTLDARKVEISLAAQGDLLIHPIPTARGVGLSNTLLGFDRQFVELLEGGLINQVQP